MDDLKGRLQSIVDTANRIAELEGDLEAKDAEIRTLINRCADLMRDKAANLAEIKRLRDKDAPAALGGKEDKST